MSFPLGSNEVMPDVGDRVAISLADGRLLHAAAIVYGLPLTGALLASILVSLVSVADLVVASATLIGFGFGFLLARWQSGRRCLMPTLRAA